MYVQVEEQNNFGLKWLYLRVIELYVKLYVGGEEFVSVYKNDNLIYYSRFSFCEGLWCIKGCDII